MAACLSCGNNIASSKAGSLTQFVLGKSVCSCNKSAPNFAKIAKAKLEISYCSRCSKKIRNKSHASLTAFLQNQNYCNCKRTVIVQKTSSILKASQLTSTSKHAEEAVMQAQLQQELETAQTLANTYKLVDSLGEGGMSFVYLAEHMRLHRLVALKIMKADLAFENNEELFREEARKLVLLNHQCLIKVLDFALHKDKWPVIAMELVSGETLADRIDRLGPIQADEALSIFKKVAEGLSYIHLKGLVHKDLKPGNIMLIHGTEGDTEKTKEGTTGPDVKILDFGISQFNQYGAQTQTSTAEIIGSPCYMSPEEWLSGKITPRTDLYALGCSLYEALTGHAPYEAETIEEIKEQHIKAPYQGLTSNSINPGYSIELERLLKSLLAKDADERPHSAQEVINSLSEILKKEQPIETQDDAGPRSLQQVLALTISAAILISTMSAAVIFYWQKTTKLATVESPPSRPFKDDFANMGLIKGVAGSMSNGNPLESKLSKITVSKTLRNGVKNGPVSPLQITQRNGITTISVPQGVSLGFLQVVRTKAVSDEIPLTNKVTIDLTKGKLFWSIEYRSSVEQAGMATFIEQMNTLPLFGLRAFYSSDRAVQKAIGRLKNLESLELYGDELTESCLFQEIDSLVKLRYLTVLHQNLSLTEDSKKPELSGELEAEQIAKLRILPQLEFIKVVGIGKPTKLVTKLSSSKNLKYLAIVGSELSENDCQQIAKIKQLKWLLLDSNALTKKSIDTLLSMQSLEAIDLTNSYIKANQVEQIATNSALRYIFTSRDKIGLSAQAFHQLQERLAARNIRLKDGTETWTARGFWEDPVATYRLR